MCRKATAILFLNKVTPKNETYKTSKQIPHHYELQNKFSYVRCSITPPSLSLPDPSLSLVFSSAHHHARELQPRVRGPRLAEGTVGDEVEDHQVRAPDADRAEVVENGVPDRAKVGDSGEQRRRRRRRKRRRMTTITATTIMVSRMTVTRMTVSRTTVARMTVSKVDGFNNNGFKGIGFKNDGFEDGNDQG